MSQSLKTNPLKITDLGKVSRETLALSFGADDRISSALGAAMRDVILQLVDLALEEHIENRRYQDLVITLQARLEAIRQITK